MLSELDIGFLGVAGALFMGGFAPRFSRYRSLIWGTAVLALITGLYPGPGAVQTLRLPVEFFGIVWWLLGAWLVKSVLNLVLTRTIFPRDDQPHARRLFADLASGFVYVVAVVGIMDTVLHEPISTVLATSGVFAIVLGLALQTTLADVFSGLAINIERPLGAGDWITVTGGVEGQVIEINWRATRLRTLANDIIIIPNSIVAKAVVTNHRRLSEPNFCTIELKIDQHVAPARVIALLIEAAGATGGDGPGSHPMAFATAFDDTLIVYQLSFAVPDFSQVATVRSDVITRTVRALAEAGVGTGNTETLVRLARQPAATAAAGAQNVYPGHSLT